MRLEVITFPRNHGTSGPLASAQSWGVVGSFEDPSLPRCAQALFPSSPLGPGRGAGGGELEERS